jgi:hypothetical protein
MLKEYQNLSAVSNQAKHDPLLSRGVAPADAAEGDPLVRGDSFG